MSDTNGFERAVEAVNPPLDPNTAAQLFYAGEVLAFTSAPTQPFVYGRWMNNPVLCSALPFANNMTSAAAYFTTRPVIIAGSYVPPPPGQAAGAILKIAGAGWTVRGIDMAVELPNGLKVDLTVDYTDTNNKPAVKPGAVDWTSSDDSIATVEVDADDDTVATVTSVAEGAVTISAISGDITATIDIDIAAASGPAVAGKITAGTPYGPPEAPAVNPLSRTSRSR